MSFQFKPTQELQFELVIVGGGMAGVCAAIAAARSGAQVALVQDRPVLGGNCSSEVRVVPYGCAHSHGWSGETGIAHELQLRDRIQNHEEFFDHGMMNSLWDLTLSGTCAAEPNLSVFLNTSVRGVECDGAQISAIRAGQMGSEKEFVFRAQQFMDATGDGTIGFLAGADFRYGRESRSEFDEPIAPVVGDDVTMGSTITMRARDCGKPVPFIAPKGIVEYKSLEEIGYNRKLYHLNKPTYGGYWWLEVCNPFHQIDDNAAIRDELHRHILGVWNFIKNHSQHQEQARNYVLEWVGQIPGKRESRRLMGDVILTEHDVQNDRKWPDGIGYAGWWIDLHISGGILNKTEPGERENVDDNYKHWIRVAPFTIPLRCYYSRNVENLWMCGRVLSVSHVALGPVRVQLSLGLQAQGVGTAAAYALKNGLSPRETADPNGPHIQKIRQQLLRDDSRLLGARNQDECDLARRASFSASSEAPFPTLQPSGHWVALNRDTAQIVPLTAPLLESARFYLKNESDQAREIAVRIEQIERIWDRTAGRVVGETALSVPARFEGWMEALLGADVEKDTPHRLVLTQTPDVFWANAGSAPLGTLCQFLYECEGGPEAKNAHLGCFSIDEVEIPAYKHWRQSGDHALATQLLPSPRPFAARMLGTGRATPEDLPNLWMSDAAQSLPQNCEFRWSEPQSFNTAILFFDTNLTLMGGSRKPFSRSPECVRDFRLLALQNDGWRVVFEGRDNFLRRVEARFGTVQASALRLEVLATNGDGSEGARVFEVRVYNE